MTTPSIVLVDTDPSLRLRTAAAEALLSGALLLADVSRDSDSWGKNVTVRTTETRFRAALELVREALSQATNP